MNSSNHDRVSDLFLEARELSADERPAFLLEACGTDSALRAEVESLLAADAQAEMLDNVPGVDLRAGLRGLAEDANGAGSALGTAIPERIGPYRIVRVVGQGGMGTVYEAEQQSPKRRVALKVIRPSMISPLLLRRFQLEAEVLGQLHHPGIAQIYEASIDDHAGGRASFFAMEFIHGEALTAYAAARGLTVPERLELVARICDAVQHAHQKGIIHRDLKPANILVVETDTGSTDKTANGRQITAVGHPKIVDFGIARILDSDQRAVTLETNVGELLGTLCYMSPEQVSGRTADLDTQCDVYALGVILFELLAERLPFSLHGLAITEAVRVVREDEPPRLSAISPALRGDLDTIVGKAMEKQRDRRYATAAELAADIRRYLNHEPIQARPTTVLYQLRKFARRNKAIVAGVSATVVALVLGLVGSLYWLQQAVQRQEQLQAVADFQGRMLTDIDVEAMGRQLVADLRTTAGESPVPDGAPGLESVDSLDRLLARVDATGVASRMLDDHVLSHAVETVGQEFADQPLIEAELRMSLGSAYESLGLWDKAREQFAAVHETRTGLLGSEHPEALVAVWSVGRMLTQLGQFEAAEPLLIEALEGLRRTHGDDDPRVLRARLHLADVKRSMSRFEEAEADLRSLHADAQRLLDNNHRLTVKTGAALGNLLRATRQAEEAESFLRDALEAARAAFGDDHPDTVRYMKDLALLLTTVRQYEAAEALYQQVHQHYLARYGGNHPDTLSAAHNLGENYLLWRQYDRAEPLVVDVLERRRALLGPEHPATIRSLNTLSHLLVRTQRREQAVEVLRESFEAGRRTLGLSNNTTTVAATNLAAALKELGRFEEAEKFIELAYQGRRESFGEGGYRTLAVAGIRGEILMAAGRFDDCRESLTGLLDQVRKPGIEGTPLYTDVLSRLARVRIATGQAVEAEPLCRELLAFCRERLASIPSAIGRAERLLALSLFHQDRFDEAVLLLEGALPPIREQYKDDHWQVHYTIVLLGVARHARDDSESVNDAMESAAAFRAQQERVKIDERRYFLEQIDVLLARIATPQPSAPAEGSAAALP